MDGELVVVHRWIGCDRLQLQATRSLEAGGVQAAHGVDVGPHLQPIQWTRVHAGPRSAFAGLVPALLKAVIDNQTG